MYGPAPAPGQALAPLLELDMTVLHASLDNVPRFQHWQALETLRLSSALRPSFVPAQM